MSDKKQKTKIYLVVFLVIVLVAFLVFKDKIFSEEGKMSLIISGNESLTRVNYFNTKTDSIKDIDMCIFTPGCEANDKFKTLRKQYQYSKFNFERFKKGKSNPFSGGGSGVQNN